MKIYERYLLPKMLNCVCGLSLLTPYRQEIVQKARGLTVEIGIGSSLNRSFYNSSTVETVIGFDPSLDLIKMARAHTNKIPILLSGGISEQIPFRDKTFDSAVVTFSFCTIPNPKQALVEIRRILRPGGELHFCEHGIAPDGLTRKTQYFIEPLWRRLAGGCHLTRDIFSLLAESGFELLEHKAQFIPSVPKFASYLYQGSARAVDRT